jgi:4'-phosphopantetheinyl transferase
MSESLAWKSPPASLVLGANEVHVWRADVNLSSAEVLRLHGTLSSEEQEKAARFHFEKDRRRYVIAHGVLRCLIGRYSGQAPNSVRFSSNPWGKPALEGLSHIAKLQFNLSHSGDIVLHAFTLGRQIGVDHERLRPDFATQEIAQRFFSSAEAGRLRSLPPEIQTRAFFNCWTRKEAYIKGRGKGLSFGLDKFDVSFAPDEPAALLGDRNDPQAVHRWSLQEADLGADYVGAAAVEGKNLQFRFWQWQE